MNYKEILAEEILKALGNDFTIHSIAAMLEKPPSLDLGEYALPCFSFAKALKKKPLEVAADLQGRIKRPFFIQKIEAKGPYLNFYLDYGRATREIVETILSKKDAFARSDEGQAKPVMIEYISPNPIKPLHVGHVRNACLGMACSRLYGRLGYKVIRAHLLNDRGIAVCKAMLAYELWGQDAEPEAVKVKPDHFVGDYYVLYGKKLEEMPGLDGQALALLRKWESQDKHAIDLWKRIVFWAMRGFEDTYKLLGADFDEWYYESDFFDKAKPIIEEGRKRGLFQSGDDGALIANLEPYGLSNKVILRPDGTSIYVTNDLALTPHKFKQYPLHESIWVVGCDQDLYFQQLFKIFEVLGYPFTKACRHVSYGMVSLPEGKMSSRQGIHIKADDLINQAIDKSRATLEEKHPELDTFELRERSLAIGLAAIKFFMLKIDSVKDFTFNMDDALSFEGETGPYLQYVFARIQSILRKAKGEGIVVPRAADVDFAVLNSEIEKKLANALIAYPDIVFNSARNFQPHSICHYLIALAQDFNSFYHSMPVLKGPEKEQAARLLLIQAVAEILEDGLGLLGVRTLEEM